MSERFDVALVAAYRRERRINAAQEFRVVLALDVLLIVSLAAAVTFILGPRALAIAWSSCAGFGLIIAGYAVFMRSPRFLDAVYAELAAFLGMLAGELALVYAFSIDEKATGWPTHTMLFAAVAVLVSFSTLAFIANFRAFTIWIMVLTSVYIGVLLSIGVPAAAAVINIISVLSLISLSTISNWLLSCNAIENFRLSNALRGEQATTERLLHSLVPAEIAERLKRGESVADPFPTVTVAFVDIVGE